MTVKYKLYVYLEKCDFWFQALSTSNQEVFEFKKKRLEAKGHKVKESVTCL